MHSKDLKYNTPIPIKISLLSFGLDGRPSRFLESFQLEDSPRVLTTDNHQFSLQLQVKYWPKAGEYKFGEEEDGIIYGLASRGPAFVDLEHLKRRMPKDYPNFTLKYKVYVDAANKMLESLCLWILAKRQGMQLEQLTQSNLNMERDFWLNLARYPNSFTPRENRLFSDCNQFIADHGADVVSLAQNVFQGKGYEPLPYSVAHQASFLSPYLPFPPVISNIIYEYQPLNKFHELKPYLRQMKFLPSSIQGCFSSVYLMSCFQSFDFSSVPAMNKPLEKPALDYNDEQAQFFLSNNKMLQAMDQAVAALSTKRHLSSESRENKKQALLKFKNKYIEAHLKDEADTTDTQLKLSIHNFYTEACRGRQSSWCSFFNRNGEKTASAKAFLQAVQQDSYTQNLLNISIIRV